MENINDNMENINDNMENINDNMENINIVWIESDVPKDLPVRQVYGFFFDSNGKILLQDDDGRYNLPGGKPEGSESYVETLRREALEESQVTFDEVHYLGFLRVENDLTYRPGTAYAQVRLNARIKELLPTAIDPATGRIYRRVFCLPSEVAKLLAWEDHGVQQVNAAQRLASRKSWI
jgi:8-oxo-dGTP pyrophosphatase MutT (NUDIX family)